jgi:DNA-binding response OmpR family regulator
MPSSIPRTGLRVHVIEDDEDIRAETVFALGELGFDPEGFGDAPSFYKAFAVQPCDIAVVDIGLPGESGLAIVSHLRAVRQRLGLVLVTARGRLEDRLLGLREGADAYLVKPVNMMELAETLNAVGRRLMAAQQENTAPLPPEPPKPAGWRLLEGDWILGDPEGRQMALTTSERAFLGCLFGQRGTAVSRDDLIRALGGDVFDFDEHRIDAIASRLRRKAAKAGMRLPLHSVRGTGYVLAN